ncbi:MAG: RNA polymerase sigma factor [Muribaculaceae bacterium]
MTQEENLIARLKQAEHRNEAFGTLLATYGNRLYWHIRRIVVTHDDAEDVMQETAVKILTSIDSYRGDSSLLTWLYRIATNEALQHLRRECRIFQSLDSLGDTLAERVAADADVDADHATVLFQQAIALLPTQQRLAFNLRYYDEMTYDDMAQVTGKSVGSLKTNYHLAVEKIKRYLKENSI